MLEDAAVPRDRPQRSAAATERTPSRSAPDTARRAPWRAAQTVCKQTVSSRRTLFDSASPTNVSCQSPVTPCQPPTRPSTLNAQIRYDLRYVSRTQSPWYASSSYATNFRISVYTTGLAPLYRGYSDGLGSHSTGSISCLQSVVYDKSITDPQQIEAVEFGP